MDHTMSNTIGKTWESRVANAPKGPLDLEFRPRLLPEISFLFDGKSLQAVKLIDGPSELDPSLMATDAVIPLEGERRERLEKIHSFLDGTRTINQIATQCDLNRELCSRFIQELYEQGIVEDAAARPAPPLSFYNHAVTLGRRESLRQLSRSPMAQHMLRGTLTKRLVVGYLVEEYHLVSSAASHISPVIAAAPTAHLRMMFSDYLSGEYWHCQLLERGLLAAGLTKEEVAASDPLPGTLAAINLLRNSARTDLLAYSVCLSINEGGDVRAAAAFSQMYDLIGQFVSPEVLAPSREHAELDFEDQHESLGAEAFVDEVTISSQRQDAIYRTVMATAGTLLEQHRQMAAFYGAAEGSLAFSHRSSARAMELT
jgi:TENA/THI-4/PQQC family